MRTTTELREQLARDIFLADNSNAPEQQMIQEWASAVNDDKDRLHGYAYNIADGLIAKGYRKPRTITTVEELDALPADVLVMTEQGGYWESIKRGDGLNWWREPGAHGGRGVSSSFDLTLPATVLWEPAA